MSENKITKNNQANIAVLEMPQRAVELGVNTEAWKALTSVVFPKVTKVESVILALEYCKANKLDIMKKPIHIVPIWDSELNCNVDTIWTGINGIRTIAFRTTSYAGKDRTVFGPMIKKTFAGYDSYKKTEVQEILEFPEWAECTVYRLVRGQRVGFTSVVYFEEAVAKTKSGVPTAMWLKRPRGQLEKCAEAAALRSAFPEELNNDDHIGTVGPNGAAIIDIDVDREVPFEEDDVSVLNSHQQEKYDLMIEAINSAKDPVKLEKFMNDYEAKKANSGLPLEQLQSIEELAKLKLAELQNKS